MTPDLSGLTKSYKFIFSFPNLRILLCEIFSLLGFWILQILIFPQIFEALTLLAVLISSIIFGLTLYLLDKEIFTFRRSVALIPIFILWGFIFDLIYTFSLNVLVPPLLTMFTIGFFLSGKKSLKVMFSLYATLCILTSILSGNLPLSAIILLYIFLVFLIHHNVDKRIYKNLNIGGISLFRSFIRYILSGDKSSLEENLSILGKFRSIPIYKILFYNNGVIGGIVVSYIHPGPLRDLGSSALPFKIIKKGEEIGIPILYLKGACTHAENLIKSESIKEVIDTLFGEKGSGENIRLLEIRRIDVDDVTTLHFLFDHKLFSIVSRTRIGMEDIPYELRELISQKISKEVILVDAHNRLPHSKTYESPISGSDLARKIEKTFEIFEKPKLSSLEVGFSHRNIGENQYEIGPGGVTSLVIKTNGKKYFLISFDGNNMVDGVRDYLYHYIVKQKNFTDGELMTTDTHVFSGLIPGVEYHAIGETLPRKYLAEITDSLLEDALKNARKVSRISITKIMVNSYFMDETKLNLLSELTRKNVRDGLILISFLFFTYLLAFLV